MDPLFMIPRRFVAGFVSAALVPIKVSFGTWTKYNVSYHCIHINGCKLNLSFEILKRKKGGVLIYQMPGKSFDMFNDAPMNTNLTVLVRENAIEFWDIGISHCARPNTAVVPLISGNACVHMLLISCLLEQCLETHW